MSNSNFKSLIGKKLTKKAPFMGEKVDISKLSTEQVFEIQEAAQGMDDSTEGDGMDIVKEVIRMSVEGAEDISNEDFNKIPLDELNNLSKAIMEFSGIASEGK
jgi:hypothetical protein